LSFFFSRSQTYFSFVLKKNENILANENQKVSKSFQIELV